MFKFIWNALNYRGRLIDNPLLDNKLMNFNLNKLWKFFQ